MELGFHPKALELAKKLASPNYGVIAKGLRQISEHVAENTVAPQIRKRVAGQLAEKFGQHPRAVRGELINTFHALGAEDQLVDVLKTDVLPELRETAADMLGSYRSRKSMLGLIRAMEHDDQDGVRVSAGASLVNYGKDALPHVERLTNHRDFNRAILAHTIFCQLNPNITEQKQSFAKVMLNFLKAPVG